MLIERAELTSGSTWHAAGGMHTLNGDPNVAKLQQYTINLYKEIEAISGQSCGMHVTGGLNLAGTKERLDWLKMAKARGRYLGMNLEIISVDEAAQDVSVHREETFRRRDVRSGRGPSRSLGRHQRLRQMRAPWPAPRSTASPASSISKQRPDGSWDVITDKGNVVAEHVVNCGGLWAREVGRMVGLELPVLAMEHHYLITEDIPGVIDPQGRQVPRHRFRGRDLHAPGRRRHADRHLRTGVPAVVASARRRGISDRTCCPTISIASRRASRPRSNISRQLGKVGIRKVVNGPFTFAPDGNPLVGPVKGMKNFWVACGVMAGFSQGGGVGLALANWMIDGDPGHDIWGMDVARYRRLGDACPTPTPRCARIIRAASASASPTRNCRRRGRCARRRSTTAWSPKTRCSAKIARLEHPLWFAPKGMEPVENVTFRRSNAHEHVGAECRARARRRRHDGDRQLRQDRSRRPARRRVPVASDGQPIAGGRQTGADADAQRAWQADRRLHHRPLRARQVPARLLLWRPRSIISAGSSAMRRRTGS